MPDDLPTAASEQWQNLGCEKSVVFRVCPLDESADLPDANQASQERARLRRQFAEEDEALRARIDYETTHPDTMVVYGQATSEPTPPALDAFGQAVAVSARPSCRDAYATGGPGGTFGLFSLLSQLLQGKSCTW
ncbi:MAG: hypothetical protein ABSF50_17040 [Burkholderiaceae bacterium]